MMPTLWSLLIAEHGRPRLHLLVIFIAGSFLTRSAGCVINDYADIRFDGHVERTRGRPLVSGRLEKHEAMIVFAALMLLALLLVLQTNTLTVILSPVAVVLMVVYPFVKRFIYMPQAVLGAAFGWGAVMAWSASRGGLSLLPFLIFAATIFWATAYDTVYAMMDVDDDIKIGVKSTAILFDKYCWIAVGMLYLFALLSMALAGWFARIGQSYYYSLLLAAVVFAHHTVRLRDKPGKDELFSIFRANVPVGMIILAGIAIADF